MKTSVKPDDIREALACGREKDQTELQIPVEDAKELLRKDDRVILVDVRSDGEMCLGHIKGARFAPPGLIAEEADNLSEDKDVPILVYCSSGDRSLGAAEKLRKMGFSNARSIVGGFTAWLKTGGEMVIGARFTVEQLDRYSRNMLLSEVGEEGQVKLMNAKVLLVGAGGLASSAGLYLAACGVGTLGIADFDRVELSNLNRQVLHGTDDIGSLKVDSAKSAIERINPNVQVIPFNLRLTSDNALNIISDFDIVMDASDNVDTKFLLNDACFFAGKPYVFGGAVGFDGQAGVFWPKAGGPCLRCLFPKPPPQHLAPT
jgi:molybdopterin/thiamine biosynthesis adenylyltransferase/rhodanese-related sulfurtransferase